MSLGVGYSSGGNGVGKDQAGKPQTGGAKVPGTTLPSLNGFSATVPVAMSASDKASSTTVSGISAGTIDITASQAQQALTGKDATTTVATLNQDVHVQQNPDGTTTVVDSQGNSTAHSLTPIFDEQTKANIKAGFAITQAFINETGTFLVNRAREADQKTQQAKEADKQADAKQAQADALPDGADKTQLQQEIVQLHQEAMTARLEARDIESKWGAGGTYRRVLTAATAAVTGNVTGSTSQFVQSTMINLVQSKAAEGIKQLADDYGIAEGSPAHAALHAILACTGAATQGGDCGSAALGAASASVVGVLLAEAQGGAEQLTNEQKEARKNLVTTLVTGVAAAMGNAEAANTAALIEMENNSNVKNVVKAALNDAKSYLGAKAQQGGEKLVNLMEKLEVQTLVDKKQAIKDYLDAAAARGGLTESEIVALGIIYAANEALFPVSVLDLPMTKAIGGAGKLIKAGTSVAVVEKVAAAEVKAAETTMLGANGTKMFSTTIWKGEGKARIDVENPNPGKRAGQIHYQDNSNNKWIYDTTTKSFYGKDGAPAPKSVNKLLEDESFKRSIEKGLRYLGEKS